MTLQTLTRLKVAFILQYLHSDLRSYMKVLLKKLTGPTEQYLLSEHLRTHIIRI